MMVVFNRVMWEALRVWKEVKNYCVASNDYVKFNETAVHEVWSARGSRKVCETSFTKIL